MSGATVVDLAATFDTPLVSNLHDGVVLSTERAALNGTLALGQRLVESEARARYPHLTTYLGHVSAVAGAAVHGST